MEFIIWGAGSGVVVCFIRIADPAARTTTPPLPGDISDMHCSVLCKGLPLQCVCKAGIGSLLFARELTVCGI